MSSPFKTIVVSASDNKYLVLANDLIASIRGLKFTYDFDLGLLDVGLSEPARQHLAGQGVNVRAVRSDIDYPARAQWEAQKPGVRTLTARPFLRDYFPDYDVYIWLDADVWVQTPEAIDQMIASASASQAIHISPELDRCYQPLFQPDGIWQMYHDWYRSNYGDAVAQRMIMMPMLNAGVFAMSASSPVWQAWARLYTEVLQTLPQLTHHSFMADQLGLNILIYRDGLPAVIMPASYNWLTFFALPSLDRASNFYVEPAIPYRPISQLHLTRPRKLQAEKISCLDGSCIERPLMYSARFL